MDINSDTSVISVKAAIGVKIAGAEPVQQQETPAPDMTADEAGLSLTGLQGGGDVSYATSLLQRIVDAASPETALKFSVEEDLSRVVVAVRAVGSDEVIQQFPPEEFISVAKFIAAQNPDVLDEDFLKGVLFDQRS